MKKKVDIYFHLEFFLTISLLFLVILLFGELISGYGLYIIFGLICGFSFSWFNRVNPPPIKLLINLAALGTFLWIIYSIVNSSLFYSDVVLICVKGVLILEIILSFNASLSGFLTYMQIVSIPLFMSYPVLARDYNTTSFILISGYIVCWFVILKLKFYGLFSPQSKRKLLRCYSVYLLVIFSLICAFVSWILFSKLPVGRIEKGGLLPKESMGLEVELKTSEKEYYVLQDEIQEKITDLILKFEFAEDRYEALALLSSLIKEPPYIMEVRKAEQGVIDYLKGSGAGLEKAEEDELIASIKNYLDKKIILNLKKNKESIPDIFKNDPFNIIDRISILNRINEIQHSNSYEQMSKYARELQKTIDKSSLNIDVKRELKESVRKSKEWKTLEFYRKKSDFLEKKIDSLDGQLKKEFRGLHSAINETERLSDLRDIEKKNDELKETATPQTRNLIKEIENLLDLKSEMLLSENNRQLKEKLESSNLPGYKLKEFKEEVNTLRDMEEVRDFLAASSEFQNKIEKDEINISQEIKESLENKIHSFIKEKIEKINDMLKDSILPVETIEEFLKGLEKLKLTKDSKKVISEAKRLESDIEKFANQGFILQETKENVIKGIEDIKELLLSRLKMDERTEDSKLLKDKNQIDYRKDWEELLEKSSLKEQRKETLKQLTQELFKARTAPEIEDIKEAAEKEIEASVKEGTRREEREKLKEGLDKLAELERMFTIDKELSGLRKKIEELKKSNPQEARRLEESLRKIRENSTNEGLQKELDNLKEYLKSQRQEKTDYQKEWEDLVEESSLREQRKEALKQLGQELVQAQTIPQVENVKEAAEKEIEDSVKEGTKREEREKLKDGLEKLVDEQLKSKAQEKADSLKEWEDLVEESSLREQRKEALKQLGQELVQAQTTPQVENVKEAAEKEIEDSVKEGTKREEREKLRDELEKLAEVKRKVAVDKELLMEESNEKEEKQAPWRISIFPSYLVLPPESSVSLKTLAVYNNIFIKELSSDLQWFSSKPGVAWVDEKGIVHSLSKGKAKISAKYKGIKSLEVEVTVVDKISETTDRAIRKELVQ